MPVRCPVVLLLRTVGGSRLYGTASPDSDWDWYEVHDRVRPRQRKDAQGQDIIKMPLGTWLRLCEKGTHQALDALWAPAHMAEVDELTSLRRSFRIDPWRVADQLERTALSMHTSKTKHTMRLLLCAERVRQRGWYDPTEWGRLVGLDSQISTL